MGPTVRITREIVLAAIRENPGISAPRLVVELGCTIRSVEGHLARLRDAGLIENMGDKRGGAAAGVCGRTGGPRKFSAWHPTRPRKRVASVFDLG